MNCKPGDLAVVVRKGGGRYDGEFIGRVVKVAHLDAEMPSAWEYEGPRMFTKDRVYEVRSFEDEILRPLRDNPGADETLTWAGKPEGVTT